MMVFLSERSRKEICLLYAYLYKINKNNKVYCSFSSENDVLSRISGVDRPMCWWQRRISTLYFYQLCI